MPRTPANSVDADRALDQDCLERFLKIRVRHVTDGQVRAISLIKFTLFSVFVTTRTKLVKLSLNLQYKS